MDGYCIAAEGIEHQHVIARRRAGGTFAFERQGVEVARIEKKWSGILREGFTDADRFRILLPRSDVGLDERLLVLAAAVFVDLQYFEAKAR